MATFHSIFYFGNLPEIQLVFVMGQSNWFIAKKKKVGLVRHPQLINMKQNKYPIIGIYIPITIIPGQLEHQLYFFQKCRNFQLKTFQRGKIL